MEHLYGDITVLAITYQRITAQQGWGGPSIPPLGPVTQWGPHILLYERDELLSCYLKPATKTPVFLLLLKQSIGKRVWWLSPCCCLVLFFYPPSLLPVPDGDLIKDSSLRKGPPIVFFFFYNVPPRKVTQLEMNLF